MTSSKPLSPAVATAYRLYQQGQATTARATLAEAPFGGQNHFAGALLRGAMELDRRRPGAAARAFMRAAVLVPGLARTYGNLSAALRRSDKFLRALDAARRAALIEPSAVVSRNALASVLLDLDCPGEALEAADSALALASDDVEATLNRGLSLQRLGRFAESRAAFDAAVRRRPDDPAPRHARAYLRLLMGDMPAGWRERETRWAMPDQTPLRTIPDVPLWDGQPLDGCRLLVLADEGRGDMIQYVRFLRHPPFVGRRITLSAPNYMVRLFAAALPDVEVRAGRPVGPFDFQTPLSRMPAVLGSDLSTLPADIPYLFAEPERVARWRNRIGDHGFRIAVCWQGNPATLLDSGRSFPLSEFAPLAAIPGVRLIALQVRHGFEQLAALPPGMTVETLGDDYDSGPDSFVDPAAVAHAVDLVISSDTALAHLAGALGRPTWTVLRKVPDFRWLIDREDSPWYPTMRLFRQRAEGDWHEVMLRIAAAVRGEMSGSGRS